jgi:hypothetical protein
VEYGCAIGLFDIVEQAEPLNDRAFEGGGKLGERLRPHLAGEVGEHVLSMP